MAVLRPGPAPVAVPSLPQLMAAARAEPLHEDSILVAQQETSKVVYYHRLALLEVPERLLAQAEAPVATRET